MKTKMWTRLGSCAFRLCHHNLVCILNLVELCCAHEFELVGMNFWTQTWLNNVCDSIYAMCLCWMCEFYAQNENKCVRRLLAHAAGAARVLHFSATVGASAA